MEESKKIILAEAGINVSKALSSFMQMEPMYEKFLNKFCSDPSFENLEKAVKEKNEDLAHLSSHTLKGISATLGMEKLYQLLLEQDNYFKKHESQAGYDLFPQIKDEYLKMIEAIKK